ncbi:MAG: hypothetical protein CMG13_04030 [Candidatus Marinimicrobia bacterium]|nr:hypothetical protein [Candidatus Neomarinimicrobiota bacterium]
MKSFFCFYLIFSVHLVLCQSPLSERYHTYSDIIYQLFEWEEEFSDNQNPNQMYPGSGIIFHMEEIGRSNVDNLPIYAVKLSYNADENLDKPRVLILGQCHAEEILGVEISMELIKRFLNPNQYISDYSNMIGILNLVELWVVPTHNPEGLTVVHGWEQEGDWLQDVSFRKNKTDVNGNGIFDFDPSGYGNDIDGVDLNRNYDFNWIFGDPVGALDGGCAANPSYISHYDYYRGEAPFSETEVQAIRDFALEKNFLLSIAYHSSRSGCVSERVIYPWVWAGGKPAPDYEVISTLGQEIAELTPVEVGDGNYHHAASGSVKGNAHDWFYSKTGCIQYLIEVGTENMQPNDNDLIEDTIDRNMAGAFHLLRRAAGINLGYGPDKFQVTGIVRDAVTLEPLVAEVEVLEMSGPMLSPRVTNEFGRYRRLLYPGTFTLEVSAVGYESQIIDNITPSSSSITQLDINLVPLNYFTLGLGINLPSDRLQDVEIIRYYNNQTDIFQVSDGDDFYWPQGQYDLLFVSDDIYPKKISVDLNSNSNIDIDLNWYDIVFSDSFEGIDNWSIIRGDWNVSEGVLYSQEGLTYDSFHPLGPQKIDLSVPFYISNTWDDEIVVKLLMKNELEWQNDTLFVDIFNDTADRFNIYSNTSQNWDYRSEYIHAIVANENNYLSLGIKSDITLQYRGLALDQLDVLREVLDGCSLGDYNHDGEINILDAVSMVGAIVNEDYLTGFQDCASDMNQDSYVNILDVIILLTSIVRNE